MSGANGLFYLSRGITASKNKAQVAGPLGKWDQRVIELRSNFNPSNVGDTASLFYAMHSLQHTCSGDGYHHHPGSMRRAFNIGHLLTGGMAQNQLLQTHTGPKLKNGRTQATDGASGHLKHPGTLLVHPQFRVNRALAQTKSRRGC